MTATNPPGNMPCPRCGGLSRVVDSRGRFRTPTVYRRRRCLSCACRFSTVEIYAPATELEANESEVAEAQCLMRIGPERRDR